MTWQWILGIGGLVVVGAIALALAMTRKSDEDEDVIGTAIPETVLADVDVDKLYADVARSYMPNASHAEVVTKIPAKKTAAKKVAAKKTTRKK